MTTNAQSIDPTTKPGFVGTSSNCGETSKATNKTKFRLRARKPKQNSIVVAEKLYERVKETLLQRNDSSFHRFRDLIYSEKPKMKRSKSQKQTNAAQSCQMWLN